MLLPHEIPNEHINHLQTNSHPYNPPNCLITLVLNLDYGRASRRGLIIDCLVASSQDDICLPIQANRDDYGIPSCNSSSRNKDWPSRCNEGSVKLAPCGATGIGQNVVRSRKCDGLAGFDRASGSAGKLGESSDAKCWIGRWTTDEELRGERVNLIEVKRGVVGGWKRRLPKRST